MTHASVALTLLLALTACDEGEPTGATCPDDSTLTYAEFGQPFFADYCTECHSVDAVDRHGAPKSVNFDTQAEIQEHATKIDAAAGSGPDASNDWMPDGAAASFPSDGEREQLAEWLACGAP
jgi:uncharacterized membrane protein